MRTTVAPLIEMAVASFLLGLATPAVCAQSAPAPLTRDQSATIRKIEGRLMAPCCYTQTIRDHDSQVAEEMREEVTAMVVSGKSEQEIITYYRAKYGETILVVPDGMSGGLLTFTPVMFFVASTGLLLFFIRRSTIHPRISKGTWRSAKRGQVGPNQFGVGLHFPKDTCQSGEQGVQSAEESIVRSVLAGMLP